MTPGQRVSYAQVVAFHNVIREMDMVERYAVAVVCTYSRFNVSRIIRESTQESKDGRISQSDFLNYAARHSRYSLFTPMEASIIFHFASRGNQDSRLALLDFAQLLDPRWTPPHEPQHDEKRSKVQTILHDTLHSAYNFVLGGIAGGFGATIVYPIDLGKFLSPAVSIHADDVDS